ncbi:MAG TPA: RNA polymerase sigma-70 factor [Chitinophagaceae bacterium]|nr:RNA polymerase sigma-70 factor [Chitinophagaceae bacterium]
MTSRPDLKDLQARIALHNDEQAYKELFHHFYPSLYQFALSLVKAGQLAEEIVSDVLIHIWQKRAALIRIQHLKLYLFISTRNTAFNYLRQMKREVVPSDDYRVQLRSVYFDPEQLLITAEMINRVQQAIHQLPPRCQLIFKLVKEDGLKHKEVAELLNLSVKTVENQMTLALRKIGSAISFDIRTTVNSGR